MPPSCRHDSASSGWILGKRRDKNRFMIKFQKMHGLGNDFVILDGRENGLTLSPEQARQISDRKRGIGCDLVALIKYSETFNEIPYVHMINADGTEIEACGNNYIGKRFRYLKNAIRFICPLRATLWRSIWGIRIVCSLWTLKMLPSRRRNSAP